MQHQSPSPVCCPSTGRARYLCPIASSRCKSTASQDAVPLNPSQDLTQLRLKAVHCQRLAGRVFGGVALLVHHHCVAFYWYVRRVLAGAAAIQKIGFPFFGKALSAVVTTLRDMSADISDIHDRGCSWVWLYSQRGFTRHLFGKLGPGYSEDFTTVLPSHHDDL